MADIAENEKLYRFGVVANVLTDRVLRTGAKVWIHRHNGDAERPIVHGLNRSGRIVEKYTSYKRLTNFRAAWIPDHLLDRIGFRWETKVEAQEFADTLSSRFRKHD